MRRAEARQERYVLRRAMRAVVKSRRVKACGRPGRRDSGDGPQQEPVVSVEYREHDGKIEAGFGGLWSCGNVWLCATCAVRIAAARAEELEAVMAELVARGMYPLLVTLTMRHHRGHALAKCLRGAQAGWKAVTTGREWQKHKGLSGFRGYVRALEVTESPENGWHVHFHVIMVFEREPSADVVDVVTGAMFARWSRGLVKAGMPAPLREFGLDVQPPDVAAAGGNLLEAARGAIRYVVKGLAAEAVLGASKEAMGSNRSIRQLMRDAVIPRAVECPETGEILHVIDETARERLAEYEQAMRGRRQLTWSQRGYDLRAQAGMREPEKTDEELVAAEETDREVLAVLPRESWAQVEPEAEDLLSVIERRGPAAGLRWLDARGIPWRRPSGPRPEAVKFEHDDHEGTT